MNKIVRFACIAVVAAVLPSAAFAKAKCVKAAGEGSGLGQEMAKMMATNALNQSITGMKAKGAAKVTCTDTALVLSTCKASQTACK